jgi:hypothetical protein
VTSGSFTSVTSGSSTEVVTGPSLSVLPFDPLAPNKASSPAKIDRNVGISSPRKILFLYGFKFLEPPVRRDTRFLVKAQEKLRLLQIQKRPFSGLFQGRIVATEEPCSNSNWSRLKPADFARRTAFSAKVCRHSKLDQSLRWRKRR